MALSPLFENGSKQSLFISVSLTVAILAVSYYTCYITYHLFFNPLKRFPGPKLWSVSQMPYVRMCLSGDGHHDVLKLHLKYGPIVRVGPNCLSINHPDASKDLRGARKNGKAENPRDPAFVAGNEDNIMGANLQDHQRFRRALSRGFSAQAMREQEPLIMQYVDQLIEKLHGECHGGAKKINIVEWLNFTTFDIIGDLTFGESFNCLHDQAYHPWVSMVFHSIKSLAHLVLIGRLPLLAPLILFTLPRGTISKWYEHRDITRQKVNRRLAFEKSRPDFMDAMLQNTKSDGNDILFNELVSNASVLVVAGSETTATLLSAVVYFLASNSDCLAKLTDEVRSRFTSEGDIDLLSVQNLPYMLAVIDESARMFPPIPTNSGRIIGSGGDTIIGQYLPEGTTVDTWQWPLYNHPEYFKQPDCFIPGRWMNDCRFDSDAKHGFLPFSIGPRDCIGKNLAYAEMRVILAKLIWNFEIRLDSECLGWNNKCKSFFMWEKEPVNIFLTPRNTNSV